MLCTNNFKAVRLFFHSLELVIDRKPDIIRYRASIRAEKHTKLLLHLVIITYFGLSGVRAPAQRSGH